MAKGNFRRSTPYRIHTPQPITKTLSQVITSATPAVKLCQIWRTTWGFLANITKFYLFIYLFIYLLYPDLGKSPTGQTRRGIFAHNGSNDGDSRKNVPFEFRSYGSLFRGSVLQNPTFGGVNRRFQAKLAKSKICILSKVLHRFQPNFAQ